MDMIINQMAKMHYMFGGRGKVPMVLRTNIGAGRGTGAQHSQSFHAVFCTYPGLVVVAPSTPYDAKGLLIEADQERQPCGLSWSTRSSMWKRRPVPEEMYRIPFGKAEIKRKGKDVTIVATHAMVLRSPEGGRGGGQGRDRRGGRLTPGPSCPWTRTRFWNP